MKRTFIKRPVLAAGGIIRTREFLIQDIDATVQVEEATRKEVLDWLDEYADNCQYDWFDGSDSAFHILYRDGSSDFINEEYDGHHIKRTGIASMVYDDSESSMVYGNYEINEYGVVTPSFETNIDPNIIPVN